MTFHPPLVCLFLLLIPLSALNCDQESCLYLFYCMQGDSFVSEGSSTVLTEAVSRGDECRKVPSQAAHLSTLSIGSVSESSWKFSFSTDFDWFRFWIADGFLELTARKNQNLDVSTSGKSVNITDKLAIATSKGANKEYSFLLHLTKEAVDKLLNSKIIHSPKYGTTYTTTNSVKDKFWHNFRDKRSCNPKEIIDACNSTQKCTKVVIHGHSVECSSGGELWTTESRVLTSSCVKLLWLFDLADGGKVGSVGKIALECRKKEESGESSSIGMWIGIGCGVLVIALIVIAVVLLFKFRDRITFLQQFPLPRRAHKSKRKEQKPSGPSVLPSTYIEGIKTLTA